MAHRTKRNKTYDVGIIGGGFAGLTLACLLGKHGVNVACVDETPEAVPSTMRTTVITYGSRQILEEAGIWAHLEGKGCPIENIEVLDGDSPVLLNLPIEDVGDKVFGWVILNADLRAAMLKAVRSHKNVTHLTPESAKDFEINDDATKISLKGGDDFQAHLTVGADGRNSFVREFMGVRTREWNYHQRAILTTIAHDNNHNNIAIEHFRTGGPLAVLPMQDDENGRHRSAVVITEHGAKSKSYMRLSDQEFEKFLTGLLPQRYGRIQILSSRAAHPLGFIHAAQYTAPRMALVADAAHGIHPAAGQGLNLGFRDVKALSDLIVATKQSGEDGGSRELLSADERARRFDNMTTAAATDGLVRLFSTSLPGMKLIRRTGLKLLANAPAAKRFIMRRAMGD